MGVDERAPSNQHSHHVTMGGDSQGGGDGHRDWQRSAHRPRRPLAPATSLFPPLFTDFFAGTMKWVELQGLAHADGAAGGAEEGALAGVVWSINHNMPKLVGTRGRMGGSG